MADAVQEKIADLEADVQRREDFVGAFTHELKTPMTSIIGYADMLHTMQTDPDEQREAAAAIVHEGRRLEALSRKLLALLGLNEEGVELTAVPLPALWPRLHAACPDVTLRTPAAAPTVRGDADLLLDLLCNLVQNAAKASAPGAPVLVLCAQAGDAVTLTVADRGCGIPPELIPRRSTWSINPAPAVRAAAAWGWRSANALPPPTAVRCASKANPAGAPGSV